MKLPSGAIATFDLESDPQVIYQGFYVTISGYITTTNIILYYQPPNVSPNTYLTYNETGSFNETESFTGSVTDYTVNIPSNNNFYSTVYTIPVNGSRKAIGTISDFIFSNQTLVPNTTSFWNYTVTGKIEIYGTSATVVDNEIAVNSMKIYKILNIIDHENLFVNKKQKKKIAFLGASIIKDSKQIVDTIRDKN
uniref:Uncharacterized protein n=1 Tax=viral metagenome TaxID=1070528 RepID=A0A6C0KNH9_9ZZZZ